MVFTKMAKEYFIKMGDMDRYLKAHYFDLWREKTFRTICITACWEFNKRMRKGELTPDLLEMRYSQRMETVIKEVKFQLFGEGL